MNERLVIDVSGLPKSECDHRALIWWGNLLLLAIESTMFALLVASYLYIRPNFEQWPPPLPSGPLGLLDPVPALRLPTINLFVIILISAPMFYADRLALRMNCAAVKVGLLLTLAIAAAAIWLRWHEFAALRFRWNDNAYASVVWTILGMHLLHLIVSAAETVILTVWILRHGLDAKHARDVRVSAVYWYWISGVWILLYALVYLGPRYF